MSRIFVLLLFLFSAPVFAAAPSVQITSAEWALPRTGETLLANPALRTVVQAYLDAPGSQLTLSYPGGDEGSLWASELKGWLVGLGVASADIDMLPGSGRADLITLTLEPAAPRTPTLADPNPKTAKETPP